jgi:hypothetical protein
MNYGMDGRATDTYLRGVLPPGLMTTIGALRGLFTPDAKAMGQVSNADRFGDELKTAFGGFPMFAELFGTNSKSTHASEFPTWLKYGALIAGASVLLPVISRAALGYGIGPLPRNIYSTPFSPAALIPMLWNQGYIRNWGAMAGFRLPGGTRLL